MTCPEAVEAAFAQSDTYEVIHALWVLMDKRYPEAHWNINTLTNGERVVHLLMRLDLEVCNGGLHQFFWNSSGDHWQVTLAMLQTIRATETARIFQEALQLFPNAAPSQDHMARSEQVRALSELQVETLWNLETVYYEQQEPLFAHAVAYLRQRQADFCEG